jgi:hypothetical protein
MMFCLTCKRSFHLLVQEQFEAGWVGLHVHRSMPGSDVTVAFNIVSKIQVSYSLFSYVILPKINIR